LVHERPTYWFNRALNFVLRTRDGWIALIGYFRPNPLSLICKALGIADASLQPEYSGLESQVKQRKALEDLLAPMVAALSTEDAVTRFQSVDLLCAPVLSLKQALVHPQVVHNGLLATVPLPGRPNTRLVGSPLRLSESPTSVRCGPPVLGSDEAAIRQRHMSS
jgi:crotonobetainyl-CoA:carnitine CoA-transferase CaiB-like acyl-CoA transferase